LGSAKPACHPWPAMRTHVCAASLVFPDPPAPQTTRSAGAVPVWHHDSRTSRSVSRPANGTIPYSGSNRRAGSRPSRGVGARYGGASATDVSPVTARRNRGPTPATRSALVPSSPASSASPSSGATGAATNRSVPNRAGSTTTTPIRNGPVNSAAPDIPAHGEPPARAAGAAVSTVTAQRPALAVVAGATNPNSCSLSRTRSGCSWAHGNPTALTAIGSVPSTRPQRGGGLPAGSGGAAGARRSTATSLSSSRHATTAATQPRSPSGRAQHTPGESTSAGVGSSARQTGRVATTWAAVSAMEGPTRYPEPTCPPPVMTGAYSSITRAVSMAISSGEAEGPATAAGCGQSRRRARHPIGDVQRLAVFVDWSQRQGDLLGCLPRPSRRPPCLHHPKPHPRIRSCIARCHHGELHRHWAYRELQSRIASRLRLAQLLPQPRHKLRQRHRPGLPALVSSAHRDPHSSPRSAGQARELRIQPPDGVVMLLELAADFYPAGPGGPDHVHIDAVIGQVPDFQRSLLGATHDPGMRDHLPGLLVRVPAQAIGHNGITAARELRFEHGA